MCRECIQHWPRGVRPVFFATPGAWELLALARGEMPVEELLRQMARYSRRDLRGAFVLAKSQPGGQEHENPLDFDEVPRERLSRFKTLLKRAFDVSQTEKELVRLRRQLHHMSQVLLVEPPSGRGLRVRSPLACLMLAAKALPLDALLRQLVEIRLQDLLAAQARLLGLAPRAYIRGRWPAAGDRPRLELLLEAAIGLHRQLGGGMPPGADVVEPQEPSAAGQMEV